MMKGVDMRWLTAIGSPFSDVDGWILLQACCQRAIMSYQCRNRGASTETRGQFLHAGCQHSPTNKVKALKVDMTGKVQ